MPAIMSSCLIIDRWSSVWLSSSKAASALSLPSSFFSSSTRYHSRYFAIANLPRHPGRQYHVDSVRELEPGGPLCVQFPPTLRRETVDPARGSADLRFPLRLDQAGVLQRL